MQVGAEDTIFSLNMTKVKVSYIEQNNMFGTYKRSIGLFDVSGSGAIAGGRFFSDNEGWDESGQPGGFNEVAFDSNYMKRIRKIEDASRYFGDDWGGTINSTPEEKCFDRGNKDIRTYSYKVFDSAGAKLAINSGFEFATGFGEGHKQGWADYWGIFLWSFDGSNPSAESSDQFYKVDYDTWDDETGMPGLDKSVAYKVVEKPIKLYKKTKASKAMSAFDSKSFEFVWIQKLGDTGLNTKVEWDHTNKKWKILATWKEDIESMTGGEWVENTESDSVPATYDLESDGSADGTMLWAWDMASNSSVQFTYDSNISDKWLAISEVEELITDDSQLPLNGSGNPDSFVCWNSCAKGGNHGVNDMKDVWTDDAARNRIYYADASIKDQVREYTISDFVISESGGSAVGIDTTGYDPSSGEWVPSIGSWVLAAKKDFDAAVTAEKTDLWEIESSLTTTYRYEMGLDSWAKTIFIKKVSDDSTVTFDPPIRIDYTVAQSDLYPGSADPHSEVGNSYPIEIMGLNLWVPWVPSGEFTDPITGETWEDYSPAFSFKKGAVVSKNSTDYKIAPEFTEIRNREASNANECDHLTMPGDSLLSQLPERKDLFADVYADFDPNAGGVGGAMCTDPNDPYCMPCDPQIDPSCGTGNQ